MHSEGAGRGPVRSHGVDRDERVQRDALERAREKHGRYLPTMNAIGDRGAAVDEVIAFYLPQFHPIRQNDDFWGPGFTEWTNVAAARPLFRGHRQPLLPADLGFYDLRLPEVRAAQADLARRYGVTAFCYWHYWFAGVELLERPLREVVGTGEPEFPFCVGWANQSWTGVWHGAPDRVLVEQTYPGFDDHRRHFDSLLDTLSDSRYLRVDGRPLFLIFDPAAVPELERSLDLWRELADDAGLGGLFIVGQCRDNDWVPQDHGFDASVATRLPRVRRRAWSEAWPDRRELCEGSYVAHLVRVGRSCSVCAPAMGQHPPIRPEGAGPPGFDARALPRARLPGSREAPRVAARSPTSLGEVLERVGGRQCPRARPRIRPRLSRSASRRYRGSPKLRTREVRATWLSPDRRPAAREISYQARRVAAGQGLLAHRKRSNDPVPVILCIDCEPDLRMIDRSVPADFEGFEIVADYFREWRSLAAEVTGAPVNLNWFFRMDTQIKACYGSAAAIPERYPAVVAEMLTAGDGLGIHPHAFRWSEEESTWFSEWKDRAWMLENLDLALDGFAQAFGHPPTLQRGGDGVITNELIAHAEARGCVTT